MNTRNRKRIASAFLTAVLLTAAGCSANTAEANDTEQEEVTETAEETAETEEVVQTVSQQTVTATAAVTSNGLLDASDYFTDRDLAQTADLSNAQYITVTDGQDINITSEGVYVITGTASEVTIRVEADDSDKVQIVLNGVQITNSDFPVIYVVNADKVFVTTTDTVNTLSVTGTFTADGSTNTDAVIFSRDDLVLNGLGTLNISSTDNGIACKDDLKITGGTYSITSSADGIEANDSVRISGGDITITSGNDAIQVNNDDDSTAGIVYICGGNLTINARDDGIHAQAAVQIDGGSMTITAAEGIESTYIQINGGSINISASDDGINAAYKSTAYTPVIDITGGEIYITMGSGDTDALDSNGSIYISGGYVNITAQYAFDFDYEGRMTGGTVIVNGEQVTSITNSMMMGGGMMGGQPGGQQGGGFGGQPSGGFGGGRP